MFKFVAFFAIIAVTAAAPGLFAATHTIVQPTLIGKRAFVDHSASSAITHQSFTNLVRKVPVVHTYAVQTPVVKTIVPVVRTLAAPIVHTVPVVHAAPVVHSYTTAPIIHSIPVVHAAPVVKSGWF